MMAIVDNQETKNNYPKRISCSIPPPGFIPRASSSVVPFTRLNSLFNLMTSGEDAAQFKSMITKLHRRELLAMASMLTSNSDYFTVIVGNKNGSVRVRMLLGKSDDVDRFLCAAILRSFLKIMTDKYACYVAVRAMLVCDKEKKKAMYELTLRYGLDIARDPQGCNVLNEVITDMDDLFYKNQLLDLVAQNTLCLSNDASGNFVVQQVLKLNDLRRTYNIAVNLHGHCVDLSSKKYGCFIVQQLLEAMEESRVLVVVELLECDGDKLIRLARNEFGHYVVGKALRVTQEMSRVDLFSDDLFYKNQILDLVAQNALCLSNDASGNFVVQQVLKLNDLRCTFNIAVNLYGHCVDLSSKKYGSYIVEQLLESAEESMVVELLRCDGDKLMGLAMHEIENFVVAKALRVTKERSRVDFFWGLVHKLMPFVKLLRRSPGSNIAKIMESTM